MKRTAARSGAAIAIVAVTVGLAGCSSSPSSNNAASKTSTAGSAATSSTAQKPQSKVAERITVDGPNPSIASYFEDSKITATPVHRGDPGAPAINFPIPDGWADAGPDTPATAYWAIVDTGPEAAKYTPSIVATLSKLDGDVDPQKLIELAGGATKTCPDSSRTAMATRTTWAVLRPTSWAEPGRKTARPRRLRTRLSSSTGTTTSTCWSSTPTACRIRSRRRCPRRSPSTRRRRSPPSSSGPLSFASCTLEVSSRSLHWT